MSWYVLRSIIEQWYDFLVSIIHFISTLAQKAQYWLFFEVSRIVTYAPFWLLFGTKRRCKYICTAPWCVIILSKDSANRFLVSQIILVCSRAQKVQICTIFSVIRPTFLPRIWPCLRSMILRSRINRKLASRDSVISRKLQQAQPSIAFILPGSTHADRLRWYFRTVDPLSSHEYGHACGQRDLGAHWIASWPHPPVW